MKRETHCPNHQLRRQFGQKLRQLRKCHQLSQEELGLESKIHRTYIGSIERGEQNISLDNIGRLADCLGIEIKEFFDF